MKRIIAAILVFVAVAAIAATTLPTAAPTPLPTTFPSTLPATLPATLPVLTLQNVVVRDTDKRAPTAQTLASGGYVAGGLPKNWTLQFNFTGAQPTTVLFTIDGKRAHIEYYIPWVCQGDNVPINLPVGDHVITYSTNGQTPQTLTFSVLPAPVFGQNMEGVSTPAGDPVAHPQLRAASSTMNFSAIRLWLEGGFTSQQPLSYFKIAKAWQTAGIRVFAVANFQNSVPRCAAPADKDWISYWTNFPTPAQTGIYAICIGNEVNTTAYYDGTVAQLAHLMLLAYPILHAKGYIVLAGSDLDDLNYYGQLNKLGAFANCDRIDVHAYYGTAAQVVACIDKGIALGRSINKPCDSTEWGVRMNANNLPAWATAQALVLSQLKTRTGYLLPFSFYPIETLDQACPLNVKYEANEPFYSAFAGALGNNMAR
jgi:hypothetical protein